LIVGNRAYIIGNGSAQIGNGSTHIGKTSAHIGNASAQTFFQSAHFPNGLDRKRPACNEHRFLMRKSVYDEIKLNVIEGFCAAEKRDALQAGTLALQS